MLARRALEESMPGQRLGVCALGACSHCFGPKEKLRKFYPLRNIVIEKNKNERDEYSKFFPAISFVDYGAISSQSRNQNRKSADEKRKNPDLLPEIEPLAEEQEEESVAYAALLSAAKPGSEAVNLEGDEKKPGSKEKSSGKGRISGLRPKKNKVPRWRNTSLTFWTCRVQPDVEGPGCWTKSRLCHQVTGTRERMRSKRSSRTRMSRK